MGIFFAILIVLYVSGIVILSDLTYKELKKYYPIQMEMQPLIPILIVILSMFWPILLIECFVLKILKKEE